LTTTHTHEGALAENSVEQSNSPGEWEESPDVADRSAQKVEWKGNVLGGAFIPLDIHNRRLMIGSQIVHEVRGTCFDVFTIPSVG